MTSLLKPLGKNLMKQDIPCMKLYQRSSNGSGLPHNWVTRAKIDFSVGLLDFKIIPKELKWENLRKIFSITVRSSTLIFGRQNRVVDIYRI